MTYPTNRPIGSGELGETIAYDDWINPDPPAGESIGAAVVQGKSDG